MWASRSLRTISAWDGAGSPPAGLGVASAMFVPSPGSGRGPDARARVPALLAPIIAGSGPTGSALPPVPIVRPACARKSRLFSAFVIDDNPAPFYHLSQPAHFAQSAESLPALLASCIFWTEGGVQMFSVILLAALTAGDNSAAF